MECSHPLKVHPLHPLPCPSITIYRLSFTPGKYRDTCAIHHRNILYRTSNFGIIAVLDVQFHTKEVRFVAISSKGLPLQFCYLLCLRYLLCELPNPECLLCHLSSQFILSQFHIGPSLSFLCLRVGRSLCMHVRFLSQPLFRVCSPNIENHPSVYTTLVDDHDSWVEICD